MSSRSALLEPQRKESRHEIEAIVGSESLGYEGAGREEHSGENSPTASKDLGEELADNRPEDLK